MLSGSPAVDKAYLSFKEEAGIHLLSHTVSGAVPSAVRGLTIVFGMGTGMSPARIDTENP